MTKGSEPAFPASFIKDEIGGLTKREWYASLAMLGFVQAYKFNPKLGEENFNAIAKASITQADALISELEAK